MVILSLSLSSHFFFIFSLTTLLYIDETLSFLKLYFGFIRFGVVFFSFPLQVAYFLSYSFGLIFVLVNI